MRYAQGNLDALEAEAIHTIREVAASLANPVLLYSIGKDSMCMLHVARKAFAPAPLPFQHVAQDHDVVGDEFLHPVAGDGAVFVDALSGHHRGDANLLEPGDQAEDFTAHH